MDYGKTWDEFSNELEKEVEKRFDDESILYCAKEYYDFISAEIHKWFEHHENEDVYKDVKHMSVEEL